MRRHIRCLWKSLVMIPLVGVFSLATCQADVMRRTASELDQTADEVDPDDELDDELGDVLSDIVEDW